MLDVTLGGLDRNQIDGLRMLEPGLVREIVGDFLESLPKDMARLRGATRASDADAVCRIAHKLRGSCGLLGMLGMTAVLQRIEACGEGRKLQGAGAELASLDRELAAVRPALQAELDRAPARC